MVDEPCKLVLAYILPGYLNYGLQFLARASKFSEEKQGPGYQRSGWRLQLIGVLPNMQ